MESIVLADMVTKIFERYRMKSAYQHSIVDYLLLN